MLDRTEVPLISVDVEVDGSVFWLRRWERSAKAAPGLPAFEDVAIGSLGTHARFTLMLEQRGEVLSVVRRAAELQRWLDGPEGDPATSDQWLAVSALARRSLATATPVADNVSALIDGRVEVRQVVALPLCSCWSTSYVLVHVSEPQSAYDVVEHVYRSTRDGFATFAPARNAWGEMVDLKVVSANPGFSRLIGLSDTLLLGRRASDLGATAAGEGLLAVLTRCFGIRGLETFELEVARDAGPPRHLSGSASAQDGLVFVSLADVTEIKSRERSFRLLFDANPVPMWLVDVETMRFLDVNAAALSHYGYEREAFLRLTQFELLHPDEHAALRSIAMGSSDSYDGERPWRHLRSDGSEILVVPYARWLSLDGRPAALAGFIDVTATHAAAQELRRTQTFLDSIVDNIPSALLVRDAVDHSSCSSTRPASSSSASTGRPRWDGLWTPAMRFTRRAACSITALPGDPRPPRSRASARWPTRARTGRSAPSTSRS